MNPIPAKLKKEIDASPKMKACWICGSHRVEIHHIFIYAGSQINALWALAPLCKPHHTGPGGFHANRAVKELIERMALESVDILWVQQHYPKRNWVQLLSYLRKYGAQELSRKGHLKPRKSQSKILTK